LSSIPEEGIVGKSRKKEIVEARQTAMFLCRNILESSLSSVGMYFGGRDHTTVMHAIKMIEKKKVVKKNIGENIAQITQELSFFSSN
jgi:chromosomal replication initiator protein